MLRIFVTGDNHIGLKYASHERAEVLSLARISAFENMVECANNEGCDLFVITGDLFENTRSVLKKDVKTVFDILSKFNGYVALLPGNHDYYDTETKLWQYINETVAEKDNILILCEYKPYLINANGNDVALYPALCRSVHSAPMQNNLAWIKAENIVPDSVYRIGVAHGAIEGETIDREGQYFLMKRTELDAIPVDAWLVGHTHVPIPKEISENYTDCGKVFNAGTHVQTDVACNTPGLCFIVEISEDKTVKAKKTVSGNIRFYRKNIVLQAEHAEEILDSELCNISDDSVVDLIISGAVSAAEYDSIYDTIESKLERFTEGTYSASALGKLISREIINAEFAETSLSAKFLGALMDDPKEAQLAYELLKSLKEKRT